MCVHSDHHFVRRRHDCEIGFFQIWFPKISCGFRLCLVASPYENSLALATDRGAPPCGDGPFLGLKTLARDEKSMKINDFLVFGLPRDQNVQFPHGPGRPALWLAPVKIRWG